MNALWHGHIRPNVRILLINNGGGEIFQTIPGFEMTEEIRRYVTAVHSTSAEGWVRERGFRYTAIHNADELAEALPDFTAQDAGTPMLLEVFTDKAEDIRLLKEYYHQLKVEDTFTTL